MHLHGKSCIKLQAHHVRSVACGSCKDISKKLIVRACSSQLSTTSMKAVSPTATSLPHIKYSFSTRDIDVAELAQLLLETPPQPGLAHSMNRGQEEAGSSAAGEAYESKVKRSLDHSLAVVVAFAAAESLPSYQAPEQLEAGEGTSGSAEEDNTWSWVMARRRRKSVKKLVGFARAIGDTALVATVHDVVVHPELRSLGLGRMLVRRLVGQLGNKGIYDVGMMAPEPVYEFFQNCSFGPDTEDSILMAFKGWEHAKPRKASRKILALTSQESERQ